jgi:hypothetical protein
MTTPQMTTPQMTTPQVTTPKSKRQHPDDNTRCHLDVVIWDVVIWGVVIWSVVILGVVIWGVVIWSGNSRQNHYLSIGGGVLVVNR